MLKTVNLTKKYGNKTVLDGITFSIKQPEIVGLIGPNGSGKTTLLNVLTGMLKPTSGGFELAPNICMGMAISRRGFFKDMSTLHNILTYATLLEISEKKVHDIMDYFEIDFGSIRFGKLSAGMKQKVSLVLAFLKSYNIVLLDEPSNHLDIDAIFKLRQYIIELNQQGTSFLITSHIFSDLEKICDRILFLKNGILDQDVRKEHLIKNYGSLEQAYLEIYKK